MYWESGEVCISILHPPGDDAWGYESAAERWLPVHTVESILVSVISMLSSPNDESPANVDAAVSILFSTPITHPTKREWRNEAATYKKKVSKCVRQSQEALYG